MNYKQLYYYIRYISKREIINKYGKLGFRRYAECIALSHEQDIEDYNKRKRIKFRLMNSEELGLYIKDIVLCDYLYTYPVESGYHYGAK